MFKYLLVENLGLFSRLEWQEHQKINILIGKNSTGKTYLLKLLYSIAKSIEEYNKSSEADSKTWKSFLSEKLFSVYQPTKQSLGEIIYKGSDRLTVRTIIRGDEYSFYLEKDSKETILQCTDLANINLVLNALYIPTKEVITSFDAIAAVNEHLKIFGFDQTYQDIIQALRIPVFNKKLTQSFEEILADLQSILQGELFLENQRFLFQQGREKYEISEIPEGIKRIGILALLIRNGTLQKNTILFIDEPEINLHPYAIIPFCDLLFCLSQIGVQIYLATHSYFVLKEFEILARKYQESIQLCCLEKSDGGINIKFNDFKEGMPDNSIIDASIKLYEEDVRLDLQA
ncbi:AAA family ATPase [Scytonema sp. NUACC26]|uniref:AAA family ATPase n=1 Tax=Scytonema sp. NUACC26 TaxID=3140176 RepID=UPI0034DC7FE8